MISLGKVLDVAANFLDDSDTFMTANISRSHVDLRVAPITMELIFFTKASLAACSMI